MSSIAHTKDHVWKLTTNRKNRLQSGFQETVSKRKYTPLKDNSMRDSKIFEKSRQRSNSPFSGLNRSKDIDITINLQKKNDKLHHQQPKQINSEPSVIFSAIKNSEQRTPNQVDQARCNASAINSIFQLQKQFKQFKDKVMKLIQRQQQQINKLAKDLLNTFQFQITKLKKISLTKCDHCKIQNQASKDQPKSLQPKNVLSNNIKVQNNSQAKQIQDIKQELNKKLEKFKKHENYTRNDQISQVIQKEKYTRQIAILDFEKIHSRFDNVFDIFNKLKSDMSEMQEIRIALQNKSIQRPVFQEDPISRSTAKQ